MGGWRPRAAGVLAAPLALVLAVGGCGAHRDGGQFIRRATAAPRSAATAPEVSPTPRTTNLTSARPTGPAANRAPTRPPPKPSGPTYPYGARRTTGNATVALTFDDGPNAAWTDQVLAVLREHKVKATFCVVGKRALADPARIRRIVADGHSLCNHTYDHNVKLGTLTEPEIRANLQATNDAIRAAAPNATISYFRHPGGAWTPLAVKVAAEMGMTSLHWSVDPRDYNRPGAEVIAEYVARHTRPGSVVLLHDGGGDRSQTAEACRLMLPALKSQFTLVALPPRPAP
jgi:peptidoglycan/xylan/chitin deacetylase (PgdA/CDA1 family)